MLDIKLIREQTDMVRENMERRADKKFLDMLDELLAIDKKSRELLNEINQLRARRNALAMEVGNKKKAGQDASAQLKEAGTIPEKLKKTEEEQEKVAERVRWLLLRVPNLLHESVPVGKDDTENVLIRTWGKPPKFKFEPKSHLDLAIQNGWIDIDRATKSSGNSFYYLRGPMVLLDLAIQRFTLDFLASKGYLAIEPPFMLRGGPFEAATDSDFLKDQIYKIDKEDLFLIGTAENAIAAMLQDEVFDNKDLPLKFAGLSACFRREVGSHGKYTKGLFRVHQFNKIEQFVFCHPDDSWKYFEEIQKNAELLYQKLGIHHRVVNVCTGDIGVMAAKKYDTEAWMCDGTFREVGSCSNDTDYQARRLNIRWREGVGKAPAGMLHTLNNTALATSRTMIAILEQHQQSDGTVKIPVPLQKYIGMKILKPISAKK